MKFKIFFLIVSLLSINLFVTACSKSQADGTQKKNKTVLKAEKSLPKLLDLGAHKCIPCKKMAPILDQLKEEFKGVMDVEFVDVWQPENKAIAQKHEIKSIPTQIYFDETGKEIWRHVGFLSKEDILAKWKELGYNFDDDSVQSCEDDCESANIQDKKGGCCGK